MYALLPYLDVFHIPRQAIGLGHFLPAQLGKPLQNINKTCTPSADHQPRTAAFRRRLCSQNRLENPLPRRLDSPRFLTKSVTSPLEHFFVTFFAPFCPSFSLVRSPKNRNVTLSLKLQHLRGPFRALRPTPERPSLSHRNDEPEPPAKTVQNWRRPRIPARPRKPTCTYESIPNSDELSYISTNNIAAADPQPDLLHRRRQIPFLAPHASPLLPPQICDAHGQWSVVSGQRWRGWGWVGRHKAELQRSVASGTAVVGSGLAGSAGQTRGPPLPEIEGNE